MGYEALQQHTRLDLARRVKTLTLDVTEWTDAPRTGAMGLAESQRAALKSGSDLVSCTIVLL